MKKFIFMILILLFANPSFSQTGTTSEMFGLDQCLWVETDDQTVQNTYCAKMIVPDGSLVDNGDGSFFLGPVSGGTFGDVAGPASSTDNAVARYDGPTGKIIQNSSVFISDLGNIGAGTSSPEVSSKIHVYSSANGAIRQKVEIASTGANAFASYYLTNTSTNAFFAHFGTGYSTSGQYIANSTLLEGQGLNGLGISAQPNNSNANIKFYTNGNNERMRITNSGLVGIGTSSPESVLDLNSSSTALRVTRLSDPSSVSVPRNGMIAYDSTDNEMQGYIGGSWVNLAKQGDVVGPASSTDNAIARFDGTTGKLIQNSGVLVDDSNNIVLPTSTASSTSGIIYKGSQTWLHDYYPTGSSGGNIFLGLDAGNLTSSWTGGEQGSYNIGIGFNALDSLTTGGANIAIGRNALDSVTTGANIIGIGSYALQSYTGTGGANIGIGRSAGQYTTGGNNFLLGINAGTGSSGLSTFTNSVMIGYFAGGSSQTNNYSTFVGINAGANVTTGVGNVIIGASPIFTPSSLVSGGSNILIGGDGTNIVDTSSSSASNELNIGNVVYGTGMYGAGNIGINTIPDTSVILDLSATDKALRVTRISDPSSDITTPRNGMIAYDSTDNQLQGYISSAWKNIGGDVTGPASSTDNAVARFNSTTGKIIQNSSGVTIDDQQNMVIAGSLDVAGTLTVGVMTVDEPNSRFRVGIEDADKIGMVIQSPSSPTAPAFEVQDSTGRPSVRFENNGFSTMRINKSGTMADASYDGFVLSVQNIGDSGEGSWIEILNSGGANRGAFFGMIGNSFQQFNWQGGDIQFWTGSGGGSPGANYPRVHITNDGNLGLAGSNAYSWTHGWGGGVGVLGLGNAATAPTTSLTTGTAIWSTSAELYTMGDSNTVKKIATTAVVTLTDGATPALNAKLGSVFSLTAAGDRTIAVPSNPTSGQRIIIRHTASGANRTLALNTGTGGFRFGTTITGLTITTSGLTDYIECIYNSDANKWDVINYQKGY